MKRMLDVLHLKTTGHVLTCASRPGEDEGPAAEVLAGPGLSYPVKKSAKVIDAPLPLEAADLARTSVPFDDGLAQALFGREAYQVKDGALVGGLGTLSVTLVGGEARLTLAAQSEDTPYVLVGVPGTGGREVVFNGLVAKNSTSHADTNSLDADIDFVLVFVKGFLPAVS